MMVSSAHKAPPSARKGFKRQHAKLLDEIDPQLVKHSFPPDYQPAWAHPVTLRRWLVFRQPVYAWPIALSEDSTSGSSLEKHGTPKTQIASYVLLTAAGKILRRDPKGYGHVWTIIRLDDLTEQDRAAIAAFASGDPRRIQENLKEQMKFLIGASRA